MILKSLKTLTIAIVIITGILANANSGPETVKIKCSKGRANFEVEVQPPFAKFRGILTYVINIPGIHVEGFDTSDPKLIYTQGASITFDQWITVKGELLQSEDTQFPDCIRWNGRACVEYDHSSRPLYTSIRQDFLLQMTPKGTGTAKVNYLYVWALYPDKPGSYKLSEFDDASCTISYIKF